jgi:long-chain acyl-CoA synthetase
MSGYPHASEETVIAAARQGMSLARYALDTPERIAVTSAVGSRTFGQLNNAANQLVRTLRDAGLGDGDSLALMMSNRPEFIEVFMAALRSGIRLTPINWHLTAEEIAYIIDDCDAKCFVTEERYADAALEAVSSIAGPDRCLMVSEIDVPGPFQRYEEALARQDSGDIDDPSRGGHMLYTSGTTGRPKGVWRETRTDIAPRWSGPRALSPLEDVCLLTGPAYHAAPLSNIAQMLISGVPVVMMDRWDPEDTLALIETHRVTHSHMVATMFHRMLQLPAEVRESFDVSSAKDITHGAAPCPVHIKQAMIEWFGPVLNEYYAATEGGGGFTVTSEEWLQKPGTVGKAPPTFDNKILDDDGNELPRGEIGTIYMKAPESGRFSYYKDDAKTQSSYRGDYFTLGDMGYFDEDGYLFLTGRTAEVIISGGVNIYPQAVDSQIMQHEAVREVCTVGVPNEEWGEEVRTVVELKSGYPESEALRDEIIAFARANLPHYMCPRQVDFADSLPRLQSGKIQRRKVRTPYWEGRDKEI